MSILKKINMNLLPEHSRRLFIVDKDPDVPENVRNAVISAKTLFAEGALRFCEEAYKTDFNTQRLCDNFSDISEKYKAIVASVESYDSMSVGTVYKYLETCKEKMKTIPHGNLFHPVMVTLILDCFNTMKNVAVEGFVLPHAPTAEARPRC